MGPNRMWVAPMIVPLGDRALLVRFGAELSELANRKAISLAHRLRDQPLRGSEEVAASLLSVLVRYDPRQAKFEDLAGEIRLRLGAAVDEVNQEIRCHRIPAQFGAAAGPDLAHVAQSLGLTTRAFLEAHNARPLRVLATGFAPGFVYCGFHPDTLHVPRRPIVRRTVEAGSLLFAAGQTAITATAIPSGWHVIGRTSFRNFDADAEPPTRLREGDEVVFEVSA